jgi:hypothetical protein
MPLTKTTQVLEQAQEFCSRNDLLLCPIPMHEVLAHPEAAEALKVFRRFAPDDPQYSFEPIATDGIALAIHKQWKEILETAKEVGTRTFWFAFHGVGEVHDQMVNRIGAYDEVCLAVERVQSEGFRCGCNTFLNKANLTQFAELMETLQAMGMEEINWSIANYVPTKRGRDYEPLRLEIQELQPLAADLSATAAWGKEKWLDLETRTEAAYYVKALEKASDSDQKWMYTEPNSIALVCRSNLDLHSGKAGTYGPLHGNLSLEKAGQVFEKAVERGSIPSEALYFSTDNVPPVSKLAEWVGDPKGHKIYLEAPSIRWRWLDLALSAHRRY